MSLGLEFRLSPERLDEGSLEERAAFGLFSLRTQSQSLTEGFDHYLNAYRPGPLVSGYHAAEWLAWNWWRLRWEPRSGAPNWNIAHKMIAIGEGYVWPNLEIWSDGVRTFMTSRPSSRQDTKPFRYVGAVPTVVPSKVFEAAVDNFMPSVIGRLRDEGVSETNLDRIWRDVLAERADPAVSTRRRLEALMGRDPDSIVDGAVEELIGDTERLGEGAVDEIAAEQARSRHNGRTGLSAERLEAEAAALGFRASARDGVILRPDVRLSRAVDVPAWKLGSEAAYAVRQQELLGALPITDGQLAELAGTTPDALADAGRDEATMAFKLDDPKGSASRIVLSGRRKTSRRFALARVLGDKLINPSGALYPATHSYTYRQKAQRSFAAELLAPFEAVNDSMRGDYSEERQQDVAESFSVSPMLINTLLENKRKIDRDNLDGEVCTAT